MTDSTRAADLDQAHTQFEDRIDVEASAFDVADPLPPLHVERVSMREMIGHQVAWQDLCDRALERNVFLEPAFALPLFQHAQADHRPDFLLVWEENGPVSFGRLIGLLVYERPTRLMPSIVRGFEDSHVKLGTPLLDKARGGDALAALVAALVDATPDIAALRLSGLDADGPFFALLSAWARSHGRGLVRYDEHRRAALARPEEGAPKVMPLVQTRRRKELMRQRRRLSERGARTYTSATTAGDVARATERFLALEHNGWKGLRGTALLANPALATFTRSMTRMMAHEGKCRIDSIEIDGAPVAMGIILTIAGRAHFWKTSFHEGFAPLSPGVQFALELTDRQLNDRSVVLTDSCALPDHPMIDRLWPDRVRVTDVLVDLAPQDPARFARACRQEKRARSIRAWAKRLYNRVRRG